MAPKLDASFALRSALRLAPSFQVLRSGFVGAATISAVLNILALTGSFFMLLVYDRAIPAHSSATLTGLVCLAVLLYGFQAALEVLRSRIFIRLGGAVNVALAEDVFASIVRTGRLAARPSDALQPVRDLDQVRAFLSGGGPAALMDLPWMALYLAICFALHAVIGLTALVGAILLIALTALTETLSRPATGRIAQLASERNGALVAAQHNADIVLAHGMLGRLSRLWFATESRYLAAQQEAADVTGGLSSLTRVLRLLLQSLVLAAGAYLVIRERASAGMIIAGSILASRALAPVELAISNWRGLAAARQSWARLGALLA
ncbi:MAG TPA: ABC transporter transmembrane domain-containing protein, partial [Caulobacteraceae bacterium]